MATKIRLQRHGRKGYAYYHIVVADSRAPRDGRFIEKLGTYNPNTNPATVDLNLDRAVRWVMVGAQPTDTTRSLLKGKGVYMKKHLLGGVAKGALTEAQADQKFNAWLSEKTAKEQAIKNKLADEAKSNSKKRLEAEQAINVAKSQAVAQKKADAAKAKAEAEAAANEAPADEPKAE